MCSLDHTLIHLLSLWDPVVCYAAYWGIAVSKTNKISHIAASISYFCWMRMWNLNLYMKTKMLALTKWRMQLNDMHFKRLNLKVLIFLEFTKNDFFFSPNSSKVFGTGENDCLIFRGKGWYGSKKFGKRKERERVLSDTRT